MKAMSESHQSGDVSCAEVVAAEQVYYLDGLLVDRRSPGAPEAPLPVRAQPEVVEQPPP